MRTEKELWEVVLSRPDLFDTGLCQWIVKVRMKCLMTYDEYLQLNRILTFKRTGNLIYWIGPKGEIQPRIEWINERIKQL